jgi:hypothetical protein
MVNSRDVMKKIVRRSVFGLLLVAAVVLLTWKLTPREPMLLDRATPLAHTDRWYHGRRFNSSIGAHWLSNEEILFDRYEGPQHDRRTIFKRNVRTGTETRLTGLTRSRDDLDAEVVDSQCVSPDGKWFLCSARWGECLLAEVNGTRHFLYPNIVDHDCSRGLHWLSDSRHWLERYGGGGEIHALILHDVENPKQATELPVNKDKEIADIQIISTLDKACVVDWPDDDVDDFGQPLKKDAQLNVTKQVTLSFVSLQSKARSRPRHTLTIPARVSDYDFHLSPQANKVAWLVNGQAASPLHVWLHRFLPGIKPIQQQTTALWVSSIDGTNRHEVGQIVETGNVPSEESSDKTLLEELKWLPDGKHLSFEYKHILYVIAAD